MIRSQGSLPGSGYALKSIGQLALVLAVLVLFGTVAWAQTAPITAFSPNLLEWDGGGRGTATTANSVNNGNAGWNFNASNKVWRPNAGAFGAHVAPGPPPVPDVNVAWTNGLHAVFGVGSNSADLATTVQVESLTTYSNSQTIGGASVALVGQIMNIGGSTTIGSLSGSNQLHRYGFWNLNLTGTNSYSGPVALHNGSTVLQNYLALSQGTLLAVNGVQIDSGAVLRIDNSIGSLSPNENNRLADDETIILSGGALELRGRGLAAHVSDENLGVLTLNGSTSTVSVNLGTGATSASLTFDDLVRNGAGTVEFIAGTGSTDGNSTLGSAGRRVKFDSGLAGMLDDGIVPFAVVNNGTDFASYNAIDGIVAAGSSAAAIDTLGATNNSKPGTDQTITTGGPLKQLNSLNLGVGIDVNIGTANRMLELASGGLLKTGSAAPGNNASVISNGMLSAGTTVAGGELVVHVTTADVGGGVPIDNSLNISANITNNSASGPVSLTKSGAGTLILSGVNFYNGATTINEGILRTGADLTFGGGDLVVAGGTFEATASFTLNRDVEIGGHAPYYLGLGTANAGALRVSDEATLTIQNHGLMGGTNGMVFLTSSITSPSPASPTLNGKINVGSGQANLTTDDTIMLGDVVVTSTAVPDAVTRIVKPLGDARLFVVNGSRATSASSFMAGTTSGDNNNVTRLNLLAAGPKVLPNTLVMPNAFNLLYIDGGAGNTVTLSGDIERADYNARVGEVGSANNTKLILDKATAGPYTGALGVTASSGEIEVRSANSWDGMLDNRDLNHLGNVQGPRAAPDALSFPANPRTQTVWFRNSNPADGPDSAVGDGQYYYSVINSEYQVFNTDGTVLGPKLPLTVEVDPAADVTLTGNRGFRSLQLYDDLKKTGAGSLTVLGSGNNIATVAAHNAQLEVRGGSVIFKDVPDAFGNYAGIQTRTDPPLPGAIGQIVDLFFDGGADLLPNGNVLTDGILNYSVHDGASLIALLGTNTAGTSHTMHFDLTLNPSAPAGIATIQVGDLPTDPSPEARKAMIVSNAPLHTIRPTPTTSWTGQLQKTGLGELVLDDTRISAIIPGAKLKILHGQVTINGDSDGAGAASRDPLSDGTDHVSVEIDTGATLEIASGVSVAESVRGDPGTLDIFNGATLLLAPGSTVNNVVAAVSLNSTGTLDLTDGALIVDYTGPSPYDTLRQKLRSGINLTGGGFWNGNGIKSLTAAAQGGPTAIGIIEAFDLALLGRTSLVDPQGGTDPLDADAVVLKYTYWGDADVDGDNDVDDFIFWSSAFPSASGATWFTGDFDYDGDNDVDDFVFWSSTFPTLAPLLGEGGDVVAVPEPSSLVLALFGLMLMPILWHTRSHRRP